MDLRDLTDNEEIYSLLSSCWKWFCYMYINIIQQPVGNFHIMTLSERCQLYRT